MQTMEYDEIIEGLAGMVSWNDFAGSLLGQYRAKGDLSHKQWDAAERMIQKCRATQDRKQAQSRAIDASRIEALLHQAKGNGLKRPVFRADGLTFSLAGKDSRNAGAVYVKAGGEYAGKIVGGKFSAVAATPLGTGDKIAAIAADPRGKAIDYGRETGTCACCGRTLTDKQSIALGIGPICAEKWGL